VLLSLFAALLASGVASADSRVTGPAKPGQTIAWTTTGRVAPGEGLSGATLRAQGELVHPLSDPFDPLFRGGTNPNCSLGQQCIAPVSVNYGFGYFDVFYYDAQGHYFMEETPSVCFDSSCVGVFTANATHNPNWRVYSITLYWTGPAAIGPGFCS
jgi:hypothetical protein